VAAFVFAFFRLVFLPLFSTATSLGSVRIRILQNADGLRRAALRNETKQALYQRAYMEEDWARARTPFRDRCVRRQCIWLLYLSFPGLAEIKDVFKLNDIDVYPFLNHKQRSIHTQKLTAHLIWCTRVHTLRFFSIFLVFIYV
jgi:hypothetical protein